MSTKSLPLPTIYLDVEKEKGLSFPNPAQDRSLDLQALQAEACHPVHCHRIFRQFSPTEPHPLELDVQIRPTGQSVSTRIHDASVI